MGEKAVGFEMRGALAVLTLNRPKALNALNQELASELAAACRRCEEPDVRAAVVTGEGRAFCAGGDLREIDGRMKAGEKMEEFLGPDYQHALAALYELSCPTVAAVNGFAVGAGCDIALACDFRLAGESATFGQVYSQVGLAPDCGGTFLLPQAVGVAKALDMILTGEIVDAQEALAIGLVRSVHPDEDLMEEALRFGERLAQGATLALKAAKRLAKRSAGLDIGAALAAEAKAQADTCRSADFAEGLSAFREKRPPQFQGR